MELSFSEYLMYLEHITSINIILIENDIELIEDEKIN